MLLGPVQGQPVVATERFDLRPLRLSDTGLLDLYAGDERVARMTRSIPHPLPPGASEAFVARSVRDDRVETVWAMDATKIGGDELLGTIGLTPMDHGQAEIGYWVAPPAWNTGLASEAVMAMIEADPLGSNTLFASVFQDNPASARVLVHCGFDYIGDAEAFSVARQSTVPTWTYLRKLG